MGAPMATGRSRDNVLTNEYRPKSPLTEAIATCWLKLMADKLAHGFADPCPVTPDFLIYDPIRRIPKLLV